MLTSFHQSGIILLVVLFYPLGYWFLSHAAQPGHAASSRSRWVGAALVVAAAVLLVAQPVLLPWLSLPILGPLGSFIHAAGLIVIAGALFLFAWLRIHLK